MTSPSETWEVVVVFSYWFNLQSLWEKQAGFIECLYWPVIHGDCHRSDIIDTDLHGAAQLGPTQCMGAQPLIISDVSFLDGLKSCLTPEQSSQSHYLWLGNRSPMSLIPYLRRFFRCGFWSYIAPFPSTLNSSFSSLSYPRFLYLRKRLQWPHICHYSYLYSRLFWHRVAGFQVR